MEQTWVQCAFRPKTALLLEYAPASTVISEVIVKQIIPILVVIAALGPVAVTAETEATPEETDVSAEAAEVATRPGDEEGTAAPSDGLAECAAILAATSPKATNIVDRNNMRNDSALWFAASGDLAAEEGGDQAGADVWETKVSDWSERIISVDGMKSQNDWMAYCSEMAKTHGLSGTFFEVVSE